MRNNKGGNGNMANLRWRRISGTTTLGSYKSNGNGTTNTYNLGTVNAYDLLDGTTGTSSNATPSVCTYNTSQATQSGCTTEFITAGGTKTYYIVTTSGKTG